VLKHLHTLELDITNKLENVVGLSANALQLEAAPLVMCCFGQNCTAHVHKLHFSASDQNSYTAVEFSGPHFMVQMFGNRYACANILAIFLLCMCRNAISRLSVKSYIAVRLNPDFLKESNNLATRQRFHYFQCKV